MRWFYGFISILTSRGLFKRPHLTITTKVVSYQSEIFSSKWELPFLPPSSLELWKKERAKRHFDRTLRYLLLKMFKCKSLNNFHGKERGFINYSAELDQDKNVIISYPLLCGLEWPVNTWNLFNSENLDKNCVVLPKFYWILTWVAFETLLINQTACNTTYYLASAICQDSWLNHEAQ